MSKQAEDSNTNMSAQKDAFASVAFWQLMAFCLLLCFVWASEFIDLPHRAFGTPARPFSLYHTSILSAAIITAAIIAVGHTYERQKALVKSLLMTCLYCHRVKTDENTWEHVEEYFMKHYPVAIDRGPCPECESMLRSIDDKKKGDGPAQSITEA